MKQTIVKCPGCGASLDLIEGRSVQFCQYCGTKVMLEEEKSNNTNVDVDVAHDFLGIGGAVKGIASIANSYIESKDREKQREHEREMEQERFLHDHPEIQKRNDRIVIGILIGFVVFIVLGIAYLHFTSN